VKVERARLLLLITAMVIMVAIVRPSPASARAHVATAYRFTGWASPAMLSKPSHKLSGGTGVQLNFTDSDRQHTAYTVCVTNPHSQITCWKRTTSDFSAVSVVRPRVWAWKTILGRFIARWYVSGRLVASWHFQMAAWE
jgi:hypothetical protein